MVVLAELEQGFCLSCIRIMLVIKSGMVYIYDVSLRGNAYK